MHLEKNKKKDSDGEGEDGEEPAEEAAKKEGGLKVRGNRQSINQSIDRAFFNLYSL